MPENTATQIITLSSRYSSKKNYSGTPYVIADRIILKGMLRYLLLIFEPKYAKG